MTVQGEPKLVSCFPVGPGRAQGLLYTAELCSQNDLSLGPFTYPLGKAALALPAGCLMPYSHAV